MKKPENLKGATEHKPENSETGLSQLLSAISSAKSITDHPEWPMFKNIKLPQYVSFYYTNKAGDEAYWDNARLIKLDLKRMLIIAEGTQGDPLNFDIYKIQHCKNTLTGERVQDLLINLVRMWEEVQDLSDETSTDSAADV